MNFSRSALFPGAKFFEDFFPKSPDIKILLVQINELGPSLYVKRVFTRFRYMSHSVKTKSPVKSSGYPVKVRPSSFGPVIVREIWKCDGILIVFQGLLDFFSSPYVTCFLKSKATSLFHLP